MAAQRAVATYAAPPVFLATDPWKQFYAALLSQLPLHNLHWKSPSRSTITIQALEVNFVALESLRDEHTSQVPQTLLEKPLLNVYIAVCEDNETYRTTVKKQIKDWHTSVSQRKNQEWLIVHVVRPEGKTVQGRIFQMKTSVLDKVKADFNTDKRDRCVQLVWSPEFDNPAAWADFITKLKDGIMSAFDNALSQREEEVKRSEGQRQMPGWNFCTFFILKESLAISFEGMNLFEEALQQYNELESSFFQVLREKNLSWFGVLILPSAQDDSLPLLSVEKKPYRELILANSISVFDFRIYLLARQCALLSRLGNVDEICKKAVAFLSGFGRRLREVEVILPLHFVESWTYSSALSVVEQCDTWANQLGLSKHILTSFGATKGELLELARHQLDIIGVRVGHLPSRPPFSIALSAPPDDTAKSKEHRSSQEISRAELISSIKDKEAFYELYVQLTNRAIELYASAGRRKFALKLHGNLAALDVFRDHLSSALQTYRNLPAHYTPHGWTSLEAFMLTQALNVYSATDKGRDRDWIHVVLEFLKAYVEDLGKELLIDSDDHKAYISGLISAFKDAAGELESDVFHPDHPAMSVTIVSKTARLAETRDGVLLDVAVRNHLPCDIPIDELVVHLAGREGARLAFSEGATLLAPGETKLTLFCPSSVSGTYTLHSSQIRVSRFVFQWKAAKLSGIGKALRAKELPPLVQVPRDLKAVDVRIRQQQRIELSEPRKLVLIVHTGRNDISSAILKVSAPGVDFKLLEVTLDEDHPNFQTTDDSIVVCDLAKDKAISMSIPHSDASAFNPMRVTISMDYVTRSEPEITRNLKLVRIVATSLPVSINVEDFFRGTRLFTRFTLSTTSHQHIRIKSARLVPLRDDMDGIKITDCVLQNPTIVTITPTQPAQFLFQLDAARGQARESLHLQITYRTLREEVESMILLAVAEVMVESPALEPLHDLLVDRLVQALENDASWVGLYEITSEVEVPGLPDEDGDVGAGIRRSKEILAKAKPRNHKFGEWREILIPVDVPQMHVLAAARLQIRANPFSDAPAGKSLPLFAGQPISAVVSVTTSFHWAPVEDMNQKSYVLRYDIEERTQDWLVSGRKRGDFTAEDGKTFSVPITLIALHHGELALPQIGITALPLPSVPRREFSMNSVIVPSCETYQLHGAEKVLVLPRGGRSTFVVSMGRAASDA